jgi:hypothetical protein
MNKVKILDYAYLAEGVYYPAWKNGHKSKHTSFLNKYSWVLAQDVDTDKKFGNPFFARLYLHLNGQQQVTAAVVAYRGTVPFSHFDNDRSDFRIAAEDKYPLGYARAVIFYQHARRYVQAHYPGVRVTVTGHSLGGALAQLVAVHFQTHAVVFNSPGVGKLPYLYPHQLAAHYKQLILNVNSSNGLLNNSGKLIGKVEHVKVASASIKSLFGFTPPGIEEVLHQHEMTSLIHALQQQNKVRFAA